MLGRSDIGQIAPGYQADFGLYDVSQVPGADTWDPVAALLLCGPLRPTDLWVQGRPVVTQGHIATLDWPKLVEDHARLARELMESP